MNKKINPWILAIRPKTILASVGPVLVGISIAFYLNQKIDLIVSFLTLICAILLQIATNIANDYLDFKKGIDTHERLGPLRVTSAGLISEGAMKNALITLLTLAFVLGLYLMTVGGTYIIIIGLLSLYFSYGYTGGPFPLSYHGLGEVSALIFFGIFAVSGTTYLQTHVFDYISFTMGIAIGFISAAILAVNNLRDTESDQKTRKKTLSVIFGTKFQRSLILFCVLTPQFFSFFFAYKLQQYLFMLTILPLLLNLKTWRHILKGPINESLNLALAKTAQYLFLYSLIIAISFFSTRPL